MADDYYQSYLDNRGMSASTFSGTDNQPVKRTKKQKYRDALDAASKFKERTDYKAKQEAQAKENARAQRATMKIADDISVMEGFTDEPFTFQGQKGTRGGILGTIGSAVGGYAFGPLGGQIGGAIGSSFG
jgi:hypothetical protein